MLPIKRGKARRMNWRRGGGKPTEEGRMGAVSWDPRVRRCAARRSLLGLHAGVAARRKRPAQAAMPRGPLRPSAKPEEVCPPRRPPRSGASGFLCRRSSPPTFWQAHHQTGFRSSGVVWRAPGQMARPLEKLMALPVPIQREAQCSSLGWVAARPHLCQGPPLGLASGVIDRRRRPSETMQVLEASVESVHPAAPEKDAAHAMLYKYCNLRCSGAWRQHNHETTHRWPPAPSP